MLHANLAKRTQLRYSTAKPELITARTCSIRHSRRPNSAGSMGLWKMTVTLFEDQFEVMALTTQSGFRYLSYLPTLWMGNLRGTEGVHFYKSDTVVCEPLDKNPVYAQVDGEPLARLPVEFKIVPRALKLLVPGTPL